ncbi:MAG: anti-sigma factor, partial [Burkholderiales bacterium]
MNLRSPEELQAVAGEYVLGLLTSEEASEVERLMRENSALNTAVHMWQDRLLPMASIARPVAPSPELWQRIARDLAPGLAAPPNAARAEKRSRFWENLNFWRFASVVGFAAAIVLAFVAFLRPPPEVIPIYTAVLQSPEDKSAGWLVEGTRAGSVTLTPLIKTSVQPNKSLQFWTKPEGAAGPTSLGLVKPNERVEIPAGKLPGLSPNQLFEITLEPEYGSPIGKPTGPILFVGRS